MKAQSSEEIQKRLGSELVAAEAKCEIIQTEVEAAEAVVKDLQRKLSAERARGPAVIALDDDLYGRLFANSRGAKLKGHVHTYMGRPVYPLSTVLTVKKKES